MRQMFVMIFAVLISTISNAQECTHPFNEQLKYVAELGLIFPAKNDAMKNYITANAISVNPLTSGVGSGFQLGVHKLLSEKATMGVIFGGNMFLVASDSTTQLYQVGTFLTGRLYFGETWKNGVFAEVGAGPEFGAASVRGGTFNFQLNFASRFGVGYNYQFSKNVTLGVSAIISPSVVANNYLDGAKIVANMLW